MPGGGWVGGGDGLDDDNRSPILAIGEVKWGGVKPDWRAESVGWVDEADRIVGTALVLYRPLPKVKRYLAYLPEGPVIDWFDADLGRWLQPLLAHLKSQGAFTVKIGPPACI